MSQHPLQWGQIQLAFANQRMPQAMLFVGPLNCNLGNFATKLMQLLLCQNNQTEPCGICMDCQRTSLMEHPDVSWLRPEKSGGVIKIDQVRELQNSAYLTPQRAAIRLIAIEGADRMNTASANALLKILEEPAEHSIFILIAQQISTVLPTVLSRCQIFRFSSSDDVYANNLLLISEQYAQGSEQALIIQKSELILDELIALIEGKAHPCVVASQWAQFELSVLLWFLYLVYAQIQNITINKPKASGPAIKQLFRLTTLLNPILIFEQIHKINMLLRKINHNININNTLVLEDLLFDLVPHQ